MGAHLLDDVGDGKVKGRRDWQRAIATTTKYTLA
jgi:hypothetical protein